MEHGVDLSKEVTQDKQTATQKPTASATDTVPRGTEIDTRKLVPFVKAVEGTGINVMTDEQYRQKIEEEREFQEKYGVEFVPQEKKVTIPYDIDDEQFALCVGTKETNYRVTDNGERLQTRGPATKAAQENIHQAMGYLLNYAILTKHLTHEERRMWREQYEKDPLFKRTYEDRNQLRLNQISAAMGALNSFAQLVRRNFSNEHPLHVNVMDIFAAMRERVYVGDGLPLADADETHSQMAYDRMDNARKVKTVEFMEDRIAEFLNLIDDYKPKTEAEQAETEQREEEQEQEEKKRKKITIRVTGAADQSDNATSPGSDSPERSDSIAPPPMEAKENLDSKS